MHDDISVALTAGVKRLDQVELALSWVVCHVSSISGWLRTKILEEGKFKGFSDWSLYLKLPDSLSWFVSTSSTH